ncbi:ATP-grasp domain-containing protein [Lactovum odontotermitis]
MKNILIVEPSFYGVSFAKEAKKLGNKVVALVTNSNDPKKYGYEDYVDKLIICDIRSADSMYEAICSNDYLGQVDALISGTDYALAETAKVAEKLGIFGISYRTAVLARNKDKAREVFQDKGVPSAKYSVVKNVKEAREAAQEIGYPVVLKPTNAASSQNVFFIDDEDSLLRAFDTISGFKTSYMNFDIRDEYLIEEYLEGQEFSVEIFVKNSKIIFSEVTEKITTPLPYFVEEFHIFPTSVYQNKKNEIITTAKQGLEAIGFSDGPAHVEVKYTKKGAKIIEINGRPGGDNITSDLIVDAYGINIFKETILLYLGELEEISPKKDEAAAIGFILSNEDRYNVSLKHIDEVLEDKSIVRYDIRKKHFSEIKQAKSSDDRLGYIIIKAEAPNIAKEKITSLLAKIKFE